MTPTQPRPALLLCHTGCLAWPQRAEQGLQLCPVGNGVAGQPGGTGPFLITVLWPRRDPLTRADAIPLWWILWDAQNWTNMQNKHLFVQTGERWSRQMESGHLGDPQVCKKQPSLQRWWGRREIAIFPGSKRGYHGVYSARKSLRFTGLKDRKDQLCKEKGLFPNTLLYLSHPAVVFSCSNRSQLQRLETFW